MSKKEPIVNHGLLQDTINYGSLIEAQSNTPTFKGGVVTESKPKVKTFGARKSVNPYRRNNSK